jgi:putative thioredoxin
MENLDSNIIFDADESNFTQKIIESSLSKLILVDFWAPWCGPCKQLTPILEKIINESKGEVLLAKVNIDENQQLASQLNIQSIPAVFAFKEKKIVDGFQGVIPEQKIIEFIEKNLGKKLKKDFSKFYEDIKSLLNEEKYEEAKDKTENHLSENSQDIIAISLYLDCLILSNLLDEANIFLESLDEIMLKDDSIQSLIKKIEIKKNNSNGPSLEELKKLLSQKPNDIDLIINLSDKLFSQNFIDEAFDNLFNNFSKKKDLKQKKILNFFEILGNNNESTIKYRKKLSSILFS